MKAVCGTTFKWPAVHIVPFEGIYEWETKLGLFQQGIARNPIQRALASFTHLAALSSVADGEILFWSMQGLEAFFCRGTGDLRRQLSEKSRLFLGEWEDKRNIVAQLYDFRSKFVHGNFNLARWNNNIEPSTVDLHDVEAAYAAVMLASRMLLSTLQKCAQDKITSVEFSYSISIEHR
jgi:hypothetical protein